MREYRQLSESRHTGRQSTQAMRRRGFAERFLVLMFCTLLIILVATCLCSMTAKSLQAKRNAETECYYNSLEQGMVKAVRGYLNRTGLKNSGVMLTRVVDAEGYRRYKLTVHHTGIDRMECSEREHLAEQLAQFAFVDSMSEFQYEFLVLGQ